MAARSAAEPVLYCGAMAAWIRRALSAVFGSGAGGSGDDALWFYVKCATCGEIIGVRVSPTSDLVQEFDDAGDTVSGYSLHKQVTGRGGMPGHPCFRLLQLDADFDTRHQLLDVRVDGGELVDQAAYEAQQQELADDQPPTT